VEEKSKDFFWPSYVDLLTGLFAVVLVLFVLVFKLFKDQKQVIQRKTDSLSVMASQAQRIREIDEQIAALEKKGTFAYDTVFKRFLVKDFNGKEIFEPGKFIIKDEFTSTAIKAGMEIRDLINSYTRDKDVTFVVLVEGNTAKQYDGNPKGSIDGNYELSYKRSLSLVNFWRENGIYFSNKTELIIARSGVYGVARDNLEENNKRFLIQVIPKIKK
jgi:flagellar motor protein MotB